MPAEVARQNCRPTGLGRWCGDPEPTRVRTAGPARAWRSVLHATATYPYVHRDRATAGLPGQLRETIAGAGARVPDWSTWVIDGPTEVEGLHGRVCFVWTATVQPHRADGNPRVAPSTPSP